ncbi:hypothetical protein MRX96_059605 [Rhipicephalus microplus]
MARFEGARRTGRYDEQTGRPRVCTAFIRHAEARHPRVSNSGRPHTNTLARRGLAYSREHEPWKRRVKKACGRREPGK